MPSLSLPFASSQDLNTTLLSDVYSTPGLLGNLSASSGTTAVSPSTPLDGSLLSPANVTYGLNGTLCAPGGPITQDPNAYRQLLRRYQQLEREFTKEREEHTSLKTSFEKLVETNKLVTAALIENTKRSRDDDLEVSAAVPSGLGTTGSSALSFSPLSRSDFPLIKFWTKEDWDSHKSLLKDTSGAKGKGPERSSRGVNTRALYMENEDGTPISGATVGQMRAVARTVWIELFDRGKAPSSWGKASLEARNLYHSELESRWAFLRLCENHWKVDALATANYSQWYLAHKAKMASIKAAKDSGVSQARAPKRAKTAVEEDDDSRNVRSEFTADPDDFGSLRSETPFEDLRVGDNQTSEAEDEVLQELGNILPRPKARPLRDPLTDVFNQPNTTPFQVLARVPDRIPHTLPTGSSERDAQDRTDPGRPMGDGQASTMTTPLPPLQTAPHESSKRRELAALRERRKARLENDRLRRLQDTRHSPGLGNTENTGEGSTTTTPVPALRDAPRGSPKRRVSATQLAELRKRMAGYREEERPRNLQKEQELRDTLANTECDAETAGESSTRTPQDSTEAGVPPVAVTAPPPQASDNVQQPEPTNSNPTELEVALAIPNLRPEDRAFVERAIFKSTKKMVPGNATTARRFCADDWCARYPNGTEGQFKYYWETLDNKSLGEYKAIEKAQKNAKAATARAAKSATVSGESASK